MSTSAPPPLLSGTPLPATSGTPPRADGPPPQQNNISWSLVFLMMAIFINLPLAGKSLTLTRPLLLIHIIQTAFLLICFVLCLLWERRKSQKVSFPTASNESVATNSWAVGVVPDSLFVAYKSRRDSILQAEWHNALTNRRTQLGLIQLPIYTMVWTVGSSINRVSGIELAARIVMTLAGCALFVFVFTILTVWQRYPRDDSERPGMIYLCADGVYDYMADKTMFVPWKMVSGIFRARGNLFIQSKQPHLQGLIFPTRAFADEASADRFIAAATQLWKANGNFGPIPPEIRAEFAPPQNG
ncbi:MAG: hypothetical protein H8F28_16750 [Fibrella sp.]|nr:hypothetical protein [Armatimonadota bacterium]